MMKDVVDDYNARVDAHRRKQTAKPPPTSESDDEMQSMMQGTGEHINPVMHYIGPIMPDDGYLRARAEDIDDNNLNIQGVRDLTIQDTNETNDAPNEPDVQGLEALTLL